jgi:hypothetical protein
MKNVSYFPQLIGFTAIISLFIVLIEWQFPARYVHEAVWWIMIFYIILTLLLHFLSVNAANKSNSTFMTAVFGSIGLKLLLSIAFIVFYLLNNRSNALWFGINFIVLYLFFTAFEIYSLLRNLRALKK